MANVLYSIAIALTFANTAKCATFIQYSLPTVLYRQYCQMYYIHSVLTSADVCAYCQMYYIYKTAKWTVLMKLPHVPYIQNCQVYYIYKLPNVLCIQYCQMYYIHSVLTANCTIYTIAIVPLSFADMCTMRWLRLVGSSKL